MNSAREQYSNSVQHCALSRVFRVHSTCTVRLVLRVVLVVARVVLIVSRVVRVVARVVHPDAPSVVRQRRPVVMCLDRPSLSPVTTWKLCRDTRPSISYCDREFSVTTEDFEKSVAIEKSLSRQKTIRILSRQRILCHDLSHPVPAPNPIATLKFCRDMGPRVFVTSTLCCRSSHAHLPVARTQAGSCA